MLASFLVHSLSESVNVMHYSTALSKGFFYRICALQVFIINIIPRLLTKNAGLNYALCIYMVSWNSQLTDRQCPEMHNAV